MRFSILILTAGLLFAQDKPAQDKPAEPKGEPNEAAVIQVKTLTGDAFQRLVSMLDVFGARVRGDGDLRTILVYAPRDVVLQMRRVVGELDRPGSEAAIGRNVDMTITILRCAPAGSAPVAALPPDMESVAKQLRAATSCKEAQVWESVPLRAQEGKLATENLRLPGAGPAGQHATLSVRAHPEAVYLKGSARYVRFAQLAIDFKLPVPTTTFGPGGNTPLVNTQFTYENLGITTSGDFMEGQKTVLGKVSGMTEGESLFAVIALKVLE